MAVPAPIALNDVIRVTFWQTLFGQRLLTVMHFRTKVAPAGGTSYAQAMQNLALRFADQTKPPLLKWLPLVAAELVFDQVRCQRVFPTTDVYMNAFIALQGTHADQANMSIDAMSIEKKTLFFPPGGVGRIQMGGIPFSQVSAGEFIPAYMVDARDAWEDLIGDQTVTADSSKYRLIVWNGGAASDEKEVFDLIPQRQVRTMHRRTLGLGI